DGALHAVDGAVGEIVDLAAADGDRFGQSAGPGALRVDLAVVVERELPVDVDSVAVLRAGRGAGDRARIVDDRRRVGGGVEIDTGAELAEDARARIVVDRDRQLAGDAVPRAGDRAAVEVMHAAEARVLEIDGVVAGAAGRREGRDLAVVVDGRVGAGPDGVGIRGGDAAGRLVGDRRRDRGGGDVVEVERLPV